MSAKQLVLIVVIAVVAAVAATVAMHLMGFERNTAVAGGVAGAVVGAGVSRMAMQKKSGR